MTDTTWSPSSSVRTAEDIVFDNSIIVLDRDHGSNQFYIINHGGANGVIPRNITWSNNTLIYNDPGYCPISIFGNSTTTGRKVSVTIDLDDLPEEQAEELSELLDKADFFELPDDLTKPAIPDAFTYNITVFSNDEQHSVRCSDSEQEQAYRLLLFYFTNLSRRAFSSCSDFISPSNHAFRN